MKKIFSVLLLFSIVFTFSACKKGSSTLERGTTEDSVYTSSFANLNFTAPDGWSFASDAELLSNTEHTAQALDSELLQDIYDEVGLAFDMSCYSPDMEKSVGVIFANTKHQEFKDYSSTEDLLNAMLEQMTLDTSSVTKETVTLCGDTYLRLCAETQTNTGGIGYATLYGKSIDDTVVIIVAACTDTFTTTDCESCFG